MNDITVTTSDLRLLLNSQAESPVLYLRRDDETGEPDETDVWADALVVHDDVIVHRHELLDALGGHDETTDALEQLLPLYQETLDGLLGEA